MLLQYVSVARLLTLQQQQEKCRWDLIIGPEVDSVLLFLLLLYLYLFSDHKN